MLVGNAELTTPVGGSDTEQAHRPAGGEPAMTVQTLITAANTQESSERRSCPGVHTLPDQPGDRFVITKDITDPDVHQRLAKHVGPGEHLGRAPAWVPSMLLDMASLEALIDAHFYRPGDRLFRMEQLPAYGVDSDGDDWRRFREEGAIEPDWSRKQEWYEVIRRERENGQDSRRVRRFGPTLTEYELYQCHMGYLYNARYEDIRVLRDDEHDVPELLEMDYWIVNEQLVVPMIYDGHGRYVGAGVLPPDRLEEFRHDRDLAWERAEPFHQWWERHPELHRGRVAA